MCRTNWSVISMQIFYSPFLQKTTSGTQNITATIFDGGRSWSRQRMALFIDTNPSIALRKSKTSKCYLKPASKKATHRHWLRARASPTHSSFSILLSLSLGNNRQPRLKGASVLQALKNKQKKKPQNDSSCCVNSTNAIGRVWFLL